MLLRNDVLEYSLPAARAVRILWIDAGQALAFIIALNAKSARPEMATVAALVDDVIAHRARLLLIDPYAAAPAPASVPPKYLEVRARGRAVVSALASNEPASTSRASAARWCSNTARCTAFPTRRSIATCGATGSAARLTARCCRTTEIRAPGARRAAPAPTSSVAARANRAATRA